MNWCLPKALRRQPPATEVSANHADANRPPHTPLAAKPNLAGCFRENSSLDPAPPEKTSMQWAAHFLILFELPYIEENFLILFELPYIEEKFATSKKIAANRRQTSLKGDWLYVRTRGLRGVMTHQASAHRAHHSKNDESPPMPNVNCSRYQAPATPGHTAMQAAFLQTLRTF